MKTIESPAELRELIRNGKWTTPTSGAASGYLQANLVMLPAAAAFNFLLFCVRNPKPCPILDVLEPGRVEPIIAPGADLCTDLPRYKIFEKGEFKTEVEDVSDYFNENMVSFLLGCSFSFENAMLAAVCRFAIWRKAKTSPCILPTNVAPQPALFPHRWW